jgi:hypothetical protein
MKRTSKVYLVSICCAILILTLQSCKKKGLPDVTTANISDITATTAASGGNVTDEGGSAVTERGVCWNTSQEPTTGSSKTSDGTGDGSFTSSITGLTANTLYYVRAYAINSEGTGYGNEVSFTTQCQTPSGTTDPASGIGSTNATLNGTVNANGSSTTVTFEYGLTNSYGNSVTATQSPVSGNSNTPVSAEITGLTPSSTYHFRVKVVSCGGTVYGDDRTFTPQCQAPTSTTNAASGLGTSSATLNGTVNANGSSTTVTFEYGFTNAYGNTVTATQSPVTGSSNTPVSIPLNGLTPGTTYHFRVKAVNCGGMVNGSDQTFTTSCQAPTATANAASGLTKYTADLNGSVNANGSSTTVTFEYGLTTSYGNSVTAAQSPVTGTSNAPVSADVSGLNPGTTYHFRVKAENCGGTVNSSDLTFTTSPEPKSILQHVGINRTNVNLSSTTVLGQITINPTESGRVIVTFDGSCTSSPGDRIVLAASNTTSWGINDGNVSVEAFDDDINTNSFSHTRVYDVSAGSRTFYALANNSVEYDGSGIASIYGSLTVKFVPNSSGSIIGHTSIVRTNYNLFNRTTLGSVTINPVVPGKVIVKFDGNCTSSPGDRIVLAASNTINWGTDDGCATVEAANNDINSNSFSHTRVYDVSPGNRTFYAVGQNYVETDGDGSASIYGSLTVLFIPNATNSIVSFQGISSLNSNLNNSTVLGQITINPSVPGKVLVRFNGTCISSPGDRILLAASNSTSWGTNDGNVPVEAIDADLNRNPFSHTRAYNVTAGSRTFYCVGVNYLETSGDGIASIYASLVVEFFPD